MKKINDLIPEATVRLKKISNGELPAFDVKSGFSEIDGHIGGFANGNLIVVGARTAVGKTSFITSCAINNAKEGVPVLFCSLDMTQQQLVNRFISVVTGVNLRKINLGLLNAEDHKRLDSRLEEVNKLPIYIDCDVPYDIEMLCEHITKGVEETNAKVVYVDYLQLLECRDKKPVENRYNEVAVCSHSLKALARKLNIPIVVTSQLNRNVELRQDILGKNMRPNMYELRDSGTICEAAKLVLLLHRPELYYQSHIDEEGNDISNLAEVIISKHNDGGTTDFKLHFDKQTSSFKEPNFQPPYPPEFFSTAMLP